MQCYPLPSFLSHLFSLCNPLTPFTELTPDRGSKLELILVPFFLILMKQRMQSLLG